ncbi:hypothetical protein D9Q98_002971 [Chlorella vulgaris]|uniref:Membrane magnesium transporter n=1 Tax=Chlorella vulgaris TaxID=3077 RepID=A0A9D4YZC3_CHLVU|nr:hypothetical protein D9Q98_002971 [Chlorella vulgaris]
MESRGVGKVLVLAGLALLLATGYQTITYREHLRLTQQQFDGLPLTLLAQLLTAVAVCALGGLNVSGTLRPIRVSDVPKTVVARPQRTDFVVFNHRGGLLANLPQLQQLPMVPEIR